MMSSASPSSQWGLRVQVAPPGGASAPTSPSTRLLDGEQLAPGPDGDVRLFAADRDVRVGGIGDAQEEVLDLGLDGRELGVDRGDPLAGGGRGSLQVGDLRAVR